MAKKFPFTRQAGLRAYGYVYTMLGTKDSNGSQDNVRGEGDSLEQPDSSQKHNYWTRQRQAPLPCANSQLISA